MIDNMIHFDYKIRYLFAIEQCRKKALMIVQPKRILVVKYNDCASQGCCKSSAADGRAP
jgi:hypothetical protein